MTENDSKLKCERYIASIANYFLQTDWEDMAKLFAQSRLEYWEEYGQALNDYDRPFEFVSDSGYIFYVPPKMYQQYNNYEQAADAINSVIEGVLGKAKYIVKLEVVDYDVNWRIRLVAESETQVVNNQNSYTAKPLIYLGLKFSSSPEIEIAKVLENKGIMYLPNCLVRAGTKDNRQARFPDFLICHNGKWGVLEVDGQTYHTSQSATKDHERTQIIQMHGKVYFTRYNAQRCLKEPIKVVEEFIELLSKNG